MEENMDVTTIPFNAFLGIEREEGSDGTRLFLQASEQYTNHLNTVHASVQFALGEAASGAYLLHLFQDIAAQQAVVPVVRNVEVKYKKPDHGAIRATAHITADMASKTRASLEKKGRALIPATVDITDSHGNTTMTATYQWFIQTLENPTEHVT
jgi:acyl-coenzyme A thioesterase PaaI-like protein